MPILSNLYDEIELLPVLENGEVRGTVSYAELYHFKGKDSEMIDSLIKQNNIVIKPEKNLYETLDRMKQQKSNILLVSDNVNVLGFVTRNRIITSYLDKRGRL